MLVLEDCHWLDPLSRDLLEVLARALAGLRVLLVLAYRPGSDAGRRTRHRDPAAFPGDRARRARRRQSGTAHPLEARRMLAADARPPAALVELVTARAQGNPFYIEELLSSFAARASIRKTSRRSKRSSCRRACTA